jgi:predicted nucleic-acid-binding Zn-ribbon protein
MITCIKCSGRMFVDRVFLSADYLELYCLICGRREMYQHPESGSKRVRWIMQMERARIKRVGNRL